MFNKENDFEVYDRNKVLNNIRKQQNLIKYNVWLECIADEDYDGENKHEIGSHFFTCYAKDELHAKRLARSNYYSHYCRIDNVEEG